MITITITNQVDRPHHGQDDLEEGLRLPGTVDVRRLAERVVDALQAGQVDPHDDVSRVPPGSGDEHQPQVDVGIAVRLRRPLWR
jgi:hypothetical protein